MEELKATIQLNKEASDPEDEAREETDLTEVVSPEKGETVRFEVPETSGPSEETGDPADQGDEEVQGSSETPGSSEAQDDSGKYTDKENLSGTRVYESDASFGLPADHPEMGELGDRILRRKAESERKKSRFRTRFYVIIFTLIMLVICFIFSLSGLFTVDSIEVRGNSRYTAEEIINMGHAVPGRNLIYHKGEKEIVEYLDQNPYIKEADVSRKLPSTLVITVSEREERLAVKYDDEYLVMDEEGMLLRKAGITPKITVAEGVVVSKIKLGEKIGVKDEDEFDDILELVKTMAESDLFFVRVDTTSSKEVRAYVYDSLIVRTGYDSLIENMKNGRLHLVLEKLFSDGIKRGTITFDSDGSASFMPVI